jgi:hypothetical protein
VPECALTPVPSLVFDPQALTALAAELGSAVAAHEYAATVLGLADERADRIQLAVMWGDVEEAAQLTTTLRSAAARAGAVGLAAAADQVESALRCRAARRQAFEAAAALPKAVARASMVIGAYLGEAATSSGVSSR